jgi:GTP-binding protein LepA
MIFDSVYDTYRGVVTYVRVVDGSICTARAHPDDVHRRRPRTARGGCDLTRSRSLRVALGAGEVGYLITGREGRPAVRVGDTVTTSERKSAKDALGATRTPSRWCSPGCTRSTAPTTRLLRDALDKLKLNDAALVYEPETSLALGFGFRCGFLGLLHLEIVRERLEREFNLDLISTAPNVVYRVVMEDGSEHGRHEPQ